MEWFLHLDIFPFVITLSVLVFVHELGHYLVARWCGVRVNEFSLGFGPQLFGRTDKHGTRWKVCLLPLGGFVKMHGDTNVASAAMGTLDMPEEEKAVAFPYKKLHQRTLIVAAGPVMNFLFAIVLMAGLFAIKGEPFAPPVVGEIMAGSTAEKVGIQLGDRILSINGKTIDNFTGVQRAVRFNAGKQLNIVIERAGETVELVAVPATSSIGDNKRGVSKIGLLGVKSTTLETRQLSPIAAIKRAVVQTAEMSTDMVTAIAQIVKGERSFKEMGGPVKIATVSGQVAETTLPAFLMFIAMLSVNLGLVNLLPIPALDGGHLFFYAAEALRGKPLSARVQEMGAMAGMGLILLLVVVVTWNDVMHLFG